MKGLPVPISVEYASYLIRIWREIDENSNWHGEMEHIQTGQRWSFDSLDDLLDFLRRQAEKSADRDRD